MPTKWNSALLQRFSDRDDIGAHRVFSEFWGEFPESEVMSLLHLIEEEYGVSPGLLRPDDVLSKFIQPVATLNPFRWLIYRARHEDRLSELNYRLKKQQKRHGTYGQWREITTLEELMRAWCGLKRA